MLQTAVIHLLIPTIPVPVPVLLGGRLHLNECGICKTGCQCHGIRSMYSSIEQDPSHRWLNIRLLYRRTFEARQKCFVC